MNGPATLTLAGSLSVALALTVSSPFPAFAIGEPPPDPNSSIASVSTSETDVSPGGTGSDGSAATLLGQAHRKCKPRTFFRFHSFRPRNFFVPRTRFIDGPGGTMTASVNRQHRVYAEMEIERERLGEINRGELIRQLRNMLNPLLAEEYIVETGHEYSQEITDGMYGNLWYRVFGYRVGFSAWREVYNCRVRRVAAGVASVPARVEGWRYWETRHPMYKGRELSKR